MSVHYIPILIDEELLAGQIARMRLRMPENEFDCGDPELCFHDELEFDRTRGITPYEYAELGPYKNNMWWQEARDISLILLSLVEKLDTTIIKSADTLYRFLGLFVLGRDYGYPFNEYGFAFSVIMGAKNAHYWHTFFKRIDFELLRPVYERERARWKDSRFIHEFTELVDYAKALDQLLIQAIKMNRTLYVVARA
jgi:hypothetical protein